VPLFRCTPVAVVTDVVAVNRALRLSDPAAQPVVKRRLIASPTKKIAEHTDSDISKFVAQFKTGGDAPRSVNEPWFRTEEEERRYRHLERAH
jgi:hypothetical protein